MNSQRATMVPTNVRNSILQDPYFQSARQSLNQALQDFQRMSGSLGLPIMAGPQAMNEMVSCLGNRQVYQPPCVLTQNLNPLNVDMHTDNMQFQPDHFEIVMDMKGFRPEEIAVTLQDNIIEVTAHHHFEGPAAVQENSMHRRYFLPRNVEAGALQSNLSSDGVLVLSAPWRIS